MATYRRRKRIWYLGGRRQVTRARTASPKHSSGHRPGSGWFPWSWGNKRRVRVNVPAFFAWEKAWRRRRR